MYEMQPQPIEKSSDYVQNLHILIHSRTLLQKRGYVLENLTKAELDSKKRCDRCLKTLPLRDRQRCEGAPGVENLSQATSHSSAPIAGHLMGLSGWTLTNKSREANNDLSPILQSSSVDEELASIFQDLDGKTEKPEKPKEKKLPIMRCQYHPGKVKYRNWTCCNEHVMAKPCYKDENHTPKVYRNGEIEGLWRFHKTPNPTNNSHVYADAVAIDCEMGVNDLGESELIRVSVVDYFSGAVLIDSLVWPDVKMKHYNTRYSGVTFRDMQEARRRRTCLFGKANARKAIWRCVSPTTIVVGHAVHQDLVSLRWIHSQVVDTLLIEEEIVKREKARLEYEQLIKEQTEGGQENDNQVYRVKPKEKGPQINLKALSLERLNREIQVKGQGHDSVEDAVASRDLLHWHLKNRMFQA